MFLLRSLISAQSISRGGREVARVELAGIYTEFSARKDTDNSNDKQTAMLINDYDNEDQLIAQSISVDGHGEIEREALTLEEDEVCTIRFFADCFGYVIVNS